MKSVSQTFRKFFILLNQQLFVSLKLRHNSLLLLQDAVKSSFNSSSVWFFFIFKNCYVLSLQRVCPFPGLTSCFISHDTHIPSAAFLSFVFLSCCPFIPFSQKLWYPQMNILWEVVVWSVQSLVRHGASNLNAVLLLTHSRTGFVYVPAESHCRLLLNLKSSIKINKNNPKESRSFRGVFCQVIASLPWACANNSS